MMLLVKDSASYRDPAGFVFSHEGIVYRQVNKNFQNDFDFFISSGLYQELTVKNLLIQHEQVTFPAVTDSDAYLFLKPEQLAFISYPYEWSFDMLKDAALLTLDIAQIAIGFGMILKDATPYNVQFHKGKMIFIDTLSFEKWDETKPWNAYRQFCENFLAPLALMHYNKLPLQALQLAYPEGIPLETASKLLPWKTKLNLHLYLHLHLNGSISKTTAPQKAVLFSAQKLKNIFKSIQSAISPLQVNYKSNWSDYYTEAEQRDDYVVNKKTIIKQWLVASNYKTAFDAGANDGSFSELLTSKEIFTISADSDHYAVNKLYQQAKQNTSFKHPLIVDLSNPSPAIGINNSERKSLISRVHVDLVMALAVIHHLAIGKNIPLETIAKLFKSLGKNLLIEFVPKEDEKVQLMLQQKKDIYDWYTEENFKAVFSLHYKFEPGQLIAPSKRTLYLMEPHEV